MINYVKKKKKKMIYNFYFKFTTNEMYIRGLFVNRSKNNNILQLVYNIIVNNFSHGLCLRKQNVYQKDFEISLFIHTHLYIMWL